MNSYERIPAELCALRQWVCWKFEKRDAKDTKVPFQPRGAQADTTNPKTWSSFADVVAACADRKRFNGIGFVFAEGGDYSGIDLDHHRDPVTGQLDEFAVRHVRRLNTYTEMSPFGTGVHMMVRATIPSETGRRDPKTGVEMYSHSRFFCMTGQHIDGTPLTIETRQQEVETMFREIFPAKRDIRKPQSAIPVALFDSELIERASRAENGAKFAALWRGDVEGAGYASQSEADAALLGLLYFWTGGDKERSFRLFPQSGLNRGKWEREDYRESTWALVAQGETYSPQSAPKSKRGLADEYLPSASDTSDEEWICRLAAMEPLEYERCRATEAKMLGISRVSILDKLVCAHRPKLQGDALQGRVTLRNVEPWDTPVDGAELLSALAAFYENFAGCQPTLRMCSRSSPCKAGAMNFSISRPSSRYGLPNTNAARVVSWT